MREKKTGELIGNIVGNGICLFLVNMTPAWQPLTRGAVLESWVDILWAANMSLIVQMAGSFLLVFFRRPAFAVFMKIFFAAASLVSLIVFFIVFPVDFSSLVGMWLNTAIKVVAIIGMGGTLISLIVNLVRLLTGRWHD